MLLAQAVLACALWPSTFQWRIRGSARGTGEVRALTPRATSKFEGIFEAAVYAACMGDPSCTGPCEYFLRRQQSWLRHHMPHHMPASCIAMVTNYRPTSSIELDAGFGGIHDSAGQRAGVFVECNEVIGIVQFVDGCCATVRGKVRTVEAAPNQIPIAVRGCSNTDVGDGAGLPSVVVEKVQPESWA